MCVTASKVTSLQNAPFGEPPRRAAKVPSLASTQSYESFATAIDDIHLPLQSFQPLYQPTMSAPQMSKGRIAAERLRMDGTRIIYYLVTHRYCQDDGDAKHG